MTERTSASTATSISRRARTPGSKRSSCRIPPTRTTTGTSGSRRSATRRTPPPASSTATGGSRRSSTTTRGSASTSARRCSPGWRRKRPTSTRRSSRPTARARTRFSGHGSAIAQAYNHMILPLANRRDKWTQVHWGIARFRAPLRPRPGGHVAGRDRRRPRNAGHPGGAGHQVHDPRAVAGRAGARDRRGGVGGCLRRADRPDARLPAAAALRPDHRPLLLRRPDLARRRLRGAAEPGRESGEPPARRVLRRARPGRSSCTSPPTARPTAITTRTATWRSPTRSITSSRTTSPA